MKKSHIHEDFFEFKEQLRAFDASLAGSWVIIPVVRIAVSLLGRDVGSGGHFSVSPYALVVINNGVKDGFVDVISLEGDDLTVDKVVKNVPGLGEKIEKFA